MNRLRALAAASFVLAAAAAGTLEARGHLQTRQTRVEIPAGTRAGRLTLANSGDMPIAVQVRVYRWTQRDGEDVLEPDPGVVASPQVAEIAAGADQLVRVVRVDGAAPAQEQAYRLVVEELPGDPAATQGSAVAVRMRYVIPVFVRAPGGAGGTGGADSLGCRVQQASLECRNDGRRAVQFGGTQIIDARGQTVELTNGLLGYVLAGSTRRFPLEPAALAAGAPRQLKVFLDGAPSTLDLARP